MLCPRENDSCHLLLIADRLSSSSFKYLDEMYALREVEEEEVGCTFMLESLSRSGFLQLRLDSRFWNLVRPGKDFDKMALGTSQSDVLFN